MKHQAKSKTHSKTKTHTKTRSRTTATHKPHTPSQTKTESVPRESLTLNTSLKSCQEIEIGDIGGFGSTRELEEHQKRCSEPATEFCSNCGRSLCRNHYDMMHRDHDGLSRHSTGPTLA